MNKWGVVYTPGFQVPEPTPMRNWYHTCEQEGAGGADAPFASLCDMDGHAEKIGKRRYVASKPERRAMLAKHTFEKHVGEPVKWPTEEELQEGRARSLERIKTWFP